jgi:cellulose synthase/poly-beta-1,6-N-acetylglucosamine synthase-like glycosyltransferase
LTRTRSVIVRPVLEDPEQVVAVAGTIRIANRAGSRRADGRSTRAAQQASRLPDRRVPARSCSSVGWDAVNSLMIVSGAFGLFRRELLLEAGGWADTVRIRADHPAASPHARRDDY